MTSTSGITRATGTSSRQVNTVRSESCRRTTSVMWVATTAGDELIALAERVELDIVSVARRVSGHVQGHVGELRVTTSDSLLLHFLTPIIADFKAQNPAVRVEMIVGNDSLNLVTL